MEISNWISHHANISPQKTAIHFENHDINYLELENRVAHLAGGLIHQLGICRGDRIAYLGENSPVLLELLFACARIGAILVPLNARMTVEQHRFYLQSCKPNCLFVETQFGEHAEDCLSVLPSIMLIQFENGLSSDGDASPYDLLVKDSIAVPASGNYFDDSPVLIAYTSGSTGKPKGAVLTNQTLLYSAINAVQMAEMSCEDHVLTNLPMFHVGGLTVQTLPALHIGASVIIHRQFDAEQTLRDIEQKRISFYLALPKISRALINHKNWHKTDLSSLRLTQTGSTLVPLSVMTPWFDRNIPVQQIYGLTEALPPVIGLPLKDSLAMAGSMGKASMYCDVRIVNEQMQDVGAGEKGEILLKGPCVFMAYWANSEETTQAFVDGWFRTGDIAHRDDEGFIYMDDRLKNIIIVGSSNVYPADLEHILSECDDIAEVAVVGRPDHDYGEVPVACIQVKVGRSITKTEVKHLFRDRLATYQHPREIFFVESFPRTSLGKIQKTEVGRMVAGMA